MAKKKPSALVETPEQRKERWKRRAVRRDQQRQQEIVHARAKRTQQLKDAARTRRKEAEPTPAMMARRAAKITAAAKKVFEKWLAKTSTQRYAMTRAGSSHYGLPHYLRGALSDLDDIAADAVKAEGG